MDIMKFLQLGGSIIIPLILLSVFAVTLILDLTWINIKSHNNLRAVDKNQTIVPSHDPVSKTFTSKGTSEDKVNILTFEIQKVERKTSLLSIIASVSPLVGLLGTVFGMIKIFLPSFF